MDFRRLTICMFAAIVLAVAAKIGGTMLSGRMVGTDSRTTLALGAGLSPLGVMGVVVAIIGILAAMKSSG